MIKSDSITKIAPALVKAQATMGKAHKSADNPFFKSKYADLSSVMDAISESLHNNGLSLTQMPGKVDNGISLTTLLIHESGEYIGCEAVLPMTKCPTAHELGSALTYLRRYSAAAITGLTQQDDDGNDATKAEKRKEKKPVDTMIPEQLLTEAAALGTSILQDVWKAQSVEARTAIVETRNDWWMSLKDSAAAA